MLTIPVWLLAVLMVPFWWLIGYFLGWLIDIVRDWWNDRIRAKQTVLLPDGNGGWIQLPNGATYRQIRRDDF